MKEKLEKVERQLVAIITLVFITLKTSGAINWAWYWVLSPLWIYLSVIVVLLVITLIVGLKDYTKE